MLSLVLSLLVRFCRCCCRCCCLFVAVVVVAAVVLFVAFVVVVAAAAAVSMDSFYSLSLPFPHAAVSIRFLFYRLLLYGNPRRTSGIVRTCLVLLLLLLLILHHAAVCI